MLRVTLFLRMAAVAMGIAAGSSAMAANPSATPQTGGQTPGGHSQPGQTPAGPQFATPSAPGCFRPGVPLCMDDGTTFISADKMSSCQGEVKEYVDKTMAYLQCLNDENIATGRDLTRNVDRFNCRLSGRKGCN